MQLPDSLPGQPPTKDHRPVKTEVQTEDGQSVLLKTEAEVVAVVAPSEDSCRVNINLMGNREKKRKKTAAI